VISVSELAKEMIAHGIRDPWGLTEFDQWVNDATRKDITTIAGQHNYEVFGLHMWGNWEKIRGKDLVGTLNFSVDSIFKNEDEPKVDQIISEYKKAAEKAWSMQVDRKAVDGLFKLALMSCTWV
jgi:hypothetical protein